MFREVSIIFIQRIWQSMAGLLTLLIVTATLTPEEQGWYYAFLSIAAMYSIFEMGMSSTILQIAAHKFASFNWFGGISAGSQSSACGSFTAKSLRAYILSAILFTIFIYPIGVYVFSTKIASSNIEASWFLPWSLLVFFTALNFLTLPFLSIVEGTGALAEVYIVKLAQGFFGAILCWIVLWKGFFLWATAMISFGSVLVACIWLKSRRKSLVTLAKTSRYVAEFDWHREVWPLQWRVGFGWIGVYLWSQLATPIVFYYQGPVEAGQIGLSITITHMIGIFAQSWIARGVPFMGQAVARNDWNSLQRIFSKDLKCALAVFLVGAAFFWGVLKFSPSTQYVNRVLPEKELVILFIFVMFYLLNNAFASQLRSFKKEPLVWIFVSGGILTLALSVWVARYSVNAVIYVMFAVQVLFVFPCSWLIWLRTNRHLQVEKIVEC